MKKFDKGFEDYKFGKWLGNFAIVLAVIMLFLGAGIIYNKENGTAIMVIFAAMGWFQVGIATRELAKDRYYIEQLKGRLRWYQIKIPKRKT